VNEIDPEGTDGTGAGQWSTLGGYLSSVGGVISGYGDLVNLSKAAKNVAHLYQAQKHMGAGELGSDLIFGAIHSFTDFLTTDDPHPFGASAGTVIITVGGVGAAKAVAGGAVASTANEGIYDVATLTGERYVGQSGNITQRLAQHVSDGKITAAEASKAIRTYVPGGKTAREIAEQLAIDKYGGPKSTNSASVLANKVNPVGLARQYIMPPRYSRP
jgi:hypothetical protein